MALPVKVYDVVLISDDYLKLVLERANKKMEINFERLSRFSKSFLEKFK